MMYLAGRWADRQLSRLELVIVVIVFSLILFVFVQYMLKIFAVAERSLMLNSITNMNTAIQYRAAAYALTGNYAALEAMQGMNPFGMISITPDVYDPDTAGTISQVMLSGMVTMRAPGNYVGELDNPDPADIAGGNWYFDMSDRTLVYRVNNTEYFKGNLPGAPRAVFRVEIEYEDRNANGQFEPETDKFIGARLQAMHQFGWEL